MRSHAALILLAATALASCESTSSAVPEPAPEPTTRTETMELSCTARVDERSFTCAPAAPDAGGARGNLITGGQGRYVVLSGSNVSFTPGSGSWSADVTVQNLIPQPLGTVDGTTPHADGVRVFFVQNPVVTAPVPGAGTITVEDRSGTGTFTASNQPYYQYSEILQQNQASNPVRWRFTVPATATRFEFKVAVAAEVPNPNGWVSLTPSADTLLAGGTATLNARVVDARGDSTAGTVTWGTSNAAIATVDSTGHVAAVAPGTAVITATSGTRTGSTTISVCPALAVGEVYVADMPGGSSLCIAGAAAAAAEYTVTPVNASTTGSVALAVTGAGIMGVTGAPTPDRLPSLRASLMAGSLPTDDAFEARLRRAERDLASLRRGAARQISPSAGGKRFTITPGVPAVGALMTLNGGTSTACSSVQPRTGRVMAVGTHLIVIADTLNPSGGLSAAQYQAIADTFDTRIYPAVTGVFGAPEDVDENQRVVAFYTSAVNALTPPSSSSYVSGFFYARDLFSAQSCAGSNEGEMFYMLAADPSGQVNGNVRSTSFVMTKTFGTLAHEFQHLINASRRMYVNTPWNGGYEEVWLNEGLSHVAEELMFFQEAGVAARGNLNSSLFATQRRRDVFLQYAEANISRLRQWLLSPHSSGAIESDDDLATRGAAWAFLRYAADRRGMTDAAFFSALVNTQSSGLANVQNVIGTDPLPWLRDFAAAMYIDDAAGSPPAAFQQPSWNFRSIYSALDYDPGPGCCDYPLAARNPSNGVADNFTLVPGGAAYLRMGVPANGFAGVTLRSGGSAPPSSIRVAVIRRK